MPKDPELETMLSEFADRLSTVVERRAANRIGALLAPVLQGHAAGTFVPVGGGNGYSRRTPQLCPVPGCSGVAAPRYSMVCKQHKDLPKAEIKKYREARKQEKRAAKVSRRTQAAAPMGGSASAVPKRGRRPAVPVR